MTETALSPEPMNDVGALQNALASLMQTNKTLDDSKALLECEKDELKSENERLKETIQSLLQARFGRKSEKMSNEDQLALELFEKIIEGNIENPAEDPDENILITTHKRKKTGRKPIPVHLPRERVIHDLTEADKVCACGHELHRIGEEVSEQLDYVPAKVKVIENVRLKYACKPCEGGIKTAPMPPQALPKSIVAPGFLSHILISKYQDHLPFYRQENILKRLAIHLPRATMSNLSLKCGALFAPLVEAAKREIVSSNYVKADETPLTVLERDGYRGSFDSYIWVFTTGDTKNRTIVYQYDPSRKGSVPEDFLRGFAGRLQTDGYSGYNSLKNKVEIEHLGCMQHSRRKFVEIVKITKDKKAGAAHHAVSVFSKLYAIEKKAKDEGLSHDEIYELRQKKSKPILESFKAWLDKTQPRVPGTSKLGKAIYYALNQWESLIVYLTDGTLDIDNNSTERVIRPIALGRNNWLFSGSEEGARATANILTLIESSKASGIEPFIYISYVLSMLPFAKTEDDYKALLPKYCDKEELANPALPSQTPDTS